MRRRASGSRILVVLLLIAAGLAACSSPDKQLDDVHKSLQGLTATTQAIGDAWLNGDVSATYSRTAFQQTLQLLDKQRAALSSSPTLLLDPRGASLSRDAGRLSRALAALMEDARNHDAASARQHLTQVPAGDSP